MPELTEGLRKRLSRVRIKVLPLDYIVVHLPPDAAPIPGEWYRPATTQFAVFIREPKTVTLVVARRKWLRMQNLFREFEIAATMRIITLEAARRDEVRKNLPSVGRILTGAGIGAVPLSSFRSDHILVPKQDLPKAVRVLRQHLAGGETEAGGRKRAPRCSRLTE
ncbi:MAG: ACT domain-containing protein [Acidobacteria bacterium]|nr:ACT domain-containing protein [Acidobacteriota bacterium]